MKFIDFFRICRLKNVKLLFYLKYINQSRHYNANRERNLNRINMITKLKGNI